MPAVEAGDVVEEQVLSNYELAFHVLPTIAEGEVATVFQSLKDIITKNGGTLSSEEAPERFDLAYEVVKYLEGRNRKFTSAYFGWVRFSANASAIEAINEDIDGVSELLRHLLVKLTKTEEANPFMFHEALEKPVVENVEAPEVVKVAKVAEVTKAAEVVKEEVVVATEEVKVEKAKEAEVDKV